MTSIVAAWLADAPAAVVTWGGVPDTDDGLFQSGGSADGTWEAGILDYWDIKSNYETNPRCTRHWHETAQVPWLYCTSGEFVTYSDTESWTIKLDYIKDLGLGGAMTWELSSDDASHTMISLMDSEL